MRSSRLLSYGLTAACLVLVSGTAVKAESAAPAAKTGSPAKAGARRKIRNAATPGVASGVPRTSEAAEVRPYTTTDTIKEFRNPLGETVYAVSASRFDVSRPLSEMAAEAPSFQEQEVEPSRNPQLPAWRAIHSDVPDPVVQSEIPSGNAFLSGPFPPAAPSTGFNFEGIPIIGGSPSDSNGSVGNDQYVETVNARYQVWSLNRTNSTATTILGPTNINALWSGFGGACQAQNSGDPIVLYDKIANRWLISQFTSSSSSGFYYQCVALSTTANAAGTYFRYAFAVPGGNFGDYPHFGVWTDAYYMMGHAFTSTSGGFVGGLFAAMDRTKMLAGDPTATWQVIQDPTEGGHMPADLDGFAPPPTGAPGIFLSVHGSGMYVYRMKVDFATPGNTVRTKQATMAIAPATGACGGGGTCIPQPSGSPVDSLGDRLMFRAAYRNLIDHESLVISHSVDPSVSGVVSGVRWYDFRLSGTPDATCPSYPCTYQQGTYADGINGRSRWMPSIAMDGAENILVGYSTTGRTNGVENNSIRYTGRAKGDPPGVMTVPEATIITGTANNTNNRWGDYTSMSVDPADDCTFWYVSQYYVVSGSWRTRIASSAWPVGSGAGQCPATSCTARPSTAPAIGTATVTGDNQVNVTWTGILPAPGAYAIERATGACGNEGLYRPVGAAPGTASNFTDTTVVGGLTYSYRVIAAADAAGKCQAQVVSGCVQATATGTCSLKPTFAGATNGTSSNGNNCGVTLAWTPAATSCPLTPNMRYDIYRGTTPDFVPSTANRVAACVSGPSSYLDTANLQSGTTYFYVVRTEDDSTGNGGECGGNEDGNSVIVPGTAYGPGTQAVPGTWTDGGGDGTAFLQMNVAGPGDTSDASWRYVKTADDAGANHTTGGAYAYRNAGPGPGNTYTANTCAEMQSPPLTAGAATVDLQYWERHQIEYHWDGIAVEYSVNGGAWTDAPTPSNSTAAGCGAGDDITGWELLSCTQAPPINGCGYPTTKHAFNGPLGSGTTCNDYATSGTVTSYAHRCHPITGLTPGDSIRFRWRFASDPGAQFAGFYLDDVAVTNVRLPNTCTPDTCLGQANGTACNDGIACTVGETCGGGVCQPGVTAPPPSEVSGVHVDGPGGATVIWSALGAGVVYDVASSTISDLRANGTVNASCLANDVAGTSFTDGRPDPAAGDGYYYLIRGQTSCANGTYGFDSSAVERSLPSACP